MVIRGMVYDIAIPTLPQDNQKSKSHTVHVEPHAMEAPEHQVGFWSPAQRRVSAQQLTNVQIQQGVGVTWRWTGDW